MKKVTLVDSATIVATERFATWEEVNDAFNSLTPGEIQKLMLSARFFKRFSPNPGSDGAELFNEAVMLAFAGGTSSGEEALPYDLSAKRGERRWRVGVPFVDFLRGIMKSLRSNEYEKSKRRGGAALSLKDELLARAADDRAATKDRCAELIALFWNDPEALRVLELLSHGLKRDDIQNFLGRCPGSPNYDTIKKRIRRRVTRLEDK